MFKYYANFMSKFEYVLYILYDNLKFNITCIVKFNENGLVKFNEELIPAIGEIVNGILAGLSILLKSDPENSDVEIPDPDESGPEGNDPEPGPNGDDSEPEDNDSNNNKTLDKGKGKAITPEAIPEENESNDNNTLDKGKGKAKDITPEVIPEETKEKFIDYDEKKFQNDLERAKLNSLKQGNGESSRQGATLQEREDEKARLDSLTEHRGESSPQGVSLGQNESAEKEREVELSYDYFCAVSESRRATIRNFNDITVKLNSKHDNMSPEQRGSLLEESVQLKKDVDNYDLYINKIKNVLNIPSEDQGYYPNNSSEESTSEYYSSSSDEESRPHKRPKK